MYSGNAYNSYGTHGHGHGAYSGYGSLSTANISYETNSKDPVLLRARVFVGNISPKIGRDEIIQLFRSYGTLLGVTVFKGYAFVQFSHGTEADLAVSALNGYNWNNSILDVKLAVSGQQLHQLQQPKPAPISHYQPTVKGMGKRNKNEFFNNAATKDMKRIKVEQTDKDKGNKIYAANLNDSDLAAICAHPNFDTLICGECRYFTTELSDFVEHRKQPCRLPKADGEPESILCSTCNEEFQSSWYLLHHHAVVHGNSLFKEVNILKSGTNANGSNEDGDIVHELDVTMEQK